MNQLKPFQLMSANSTHAIIEIFGGDNNLNDFVVEDMKEMMAGMSPNMSALCLADFVNDEAYVVELTSNGGRVIESLGEIDTGAPEVLADFLSRALISYSGNTKISIGFWDHGSGVFDEYDPNEDILNKRLRSIPKRKSRLRPARKLFISRLNSTEKAMLHDDTNGGVLTTREAGSVIKAAFDRAGISGNKVDMIFSDTCLNGMVEVLFEFAPFAKVVTASEDLEPGDGWDYDLWLSKMADNPPAGHEDWGQHAVEAFGESYEKRPGLHPCTLGSFKTENNIAGSFKQLINVVDKHGDDGFSWMRDAREFTQSFATYASYDILHFAENLKHYAKDDEVKSKADDLANAFKNSRVHFVALGRTVSNSNGLSFWFPENRYNFIKNADTYSKLSFDKATGWTDYLKKQYKI